MAKYTFLSDVVNHGGMVSKEFSGGPVIPRGTELELDPKNDHIKWLLAGGSILLASSAEDDKPKNEVLDQNAANAISHVESTDLTEDELNELLVFENENKKRSTVVKAIEDKLASLQKSDQTPPDDAPPAE